MSKRSEISGYHTPSEILLDLICRGGVVDFQNLRLHHVMNVPDLSATRTAEDIWV